MALLQELTAADRCGNLNQTIVWIRVELRYCTTARQLKLAVCISAVLYTRITTIQLRHSEIVVIKKHFLISFTFTAAVLFASCQRSASRPLGGKKQQIKANSYSPVTSSSSLSSW